ncbi:SusC/RagA family TonB-linked outer membrane protein [Bacteroidia bacterium]|nr:SusC/RagA family TonB-linked outer membrane protein [Bacteroidia bacterium]GHT46826.1 SusC/RagA family TonB-linked outer membrane protein [Bacteroidia bacterium]
MIHRVAVLLFCLAISSSLYAQKRVQGTVVDTKGEVVIGASVVVDKTTRGTVTDIDGKFSITAGSNESLKITYIGYKENIVLVGNQTELVIVLEENQEMLDEVVVVAFGTQKKESMISSIETVNPKELKVPSSNLTTALAGRVSGLIAYQRSGEPGKDNADFFIRGVTTFGYKKDPLILIDGVETNSTELARLTPDDIEAFSILKDATATALYGARGANGVIQIKTKEGQEGPAKVQVRLENSFSSNTRNIELADPITFMQLNNEARNTRNLIGSTDSRYTPEKIDQTIRGGNPYVYPANDWRELLIKDVASNQRANLSVSGGGGIARYYIAGSYTKDNGNLKVDKKNNFNNNIDLRSYQLRSNININVTKTTEAIVRLAGSFDDYTGPLDGGEGMYQKIMQANPVEFPAYFPAEYSVGTQHILFGNAPRGNMAAGYINPYADLVRGYKESTKSRIEAAFEVKQDFGFITPGLNGRALFNTSRYAYFDVMRAYNPYYYAVSNYDRFSGELPTIRLLNEENNPTEYLNYAQGEKDTNSTVYVEAALTYNKKVNDVHDISGLLVYQHRNQLYSNKETLQLSLPYRNQGVSGRFTYGFDSRYLVELNFGYNGSERFHKSERFGFFPAVGGGWIVSNEKFWSGLEKTLPKFKLKGTYGLVGNDAIGDENDRFFYLSEMNMAEGGRGYTFGQGLNSGGQTRDGVRILRYENKAITWETAYKTNLGFELNVLGNFEIQADYFTEQRKNILMTRSSIPSTMGLSADVKANVGEAKAGGFDASIDYNKFFKSGFWLQGRANFTYAHSEFTLYEEPEYKEKYKSRVGNSLNQQYGLIAERLFVDDYEVANSPTQTFGEYMAGDIKYRDVNGDGIITDLDEVPLGYPEVPEIVYGFGLSTGNDNFDVSLFFQGQARSSFWIDATETSPFSFNDNGQRPILKVYADSHWSENNRDLYAIWPRLSENVIANNTHRSSWFMRDGSFLRLKTLEVGYKLPRKLLRKAHLDNIRIYATGNNLLLFSRFNLWDIEMGGKGLGYPIQKVYNVGIQIGF